ncbi:MAG: choice-of-anchor B family protein [Planctomycetota bacterium]|nr:choice-of-anchor B family protein [Planctomycetota bacterium]
MPHGMKTALGLLSLGLVCATVIAHEGDEKWRDRQGPYQGSIYRAADGGVADVAFDAVGVSLLSWFPLNTLSPGATSAADCWGYVTPTGREIAIIGVSTGTAFVDITNPTSPTQIGFVTGPTSLWRDVQVFDKYAYSVSEGGGGIQVISMVSADSGQVGLTNTVTTGGVASTHTVIINEQSGFLYRCGGGSNIGLRIYDLNQSKTNPPFVGQWLDRYVHEAQIVSYTTGPYAGKEIAFCCGGFNNGSGSTGLFIVDVTNKAAPVLMGSLQYPNAAYCHQGWLSADRQYYYVDDELDEGASVSTTTIIILDVSNLSAPTFVSAPNNGNPAIGHNLYVKNNKIYAANYRSGLRVFDITGNGLTLTETSYFDTYAGSDSPNFNGLWGNYPFFPSGVVIGSDLESGLFVWRVGPNPIQFQFPTPVPAMIDPVGLMVDVNLILQPGVIVVPGSERLLVSVGGVETSIPMMQLGTTSYRVTIPAKACGTTGGIAFRAQEGGGEVFRSPVSGFTPLIWAYGTTTGAIDNLETPTAWVIGGTGDAATTGIWTRVDPNGTAAQPEDDHTPIGTNCFVTGQGTVGGAIGEADVDGIQTTLTSPTMNATVAGSPVISFWYWYSNNGGSNPNEDPFVVDMSNNGGTTWTNVLTTLVSTGAWTEHRIQVENYLPPTATMKLRFRATDAGAGGSIVEAAIDDISVFGYDCDAPTNPGDVNADGLVDGQDLALMLGAWGTANAAADISGDGLVDGQDLAILVANWG